MKRCMTLVMSMILVFSLAACSSNTDTKQSDNQQTEDVGEVGETESFDELGTENSETEKTLIAYFSIPEDVDTSGMDAIAGASIVVYDDEVMGNTEYVANIIQQTIGGDMPQPLYTFLEEYDLSGKTIIPFVTHGGSGFSNTIDAITNLQPNAIVSDHTFSLSRNNVSGSAADVAVWAESLGIH